LGLRLDMLLLVDVSGLLGVFFYAFRLFLALEYSF